MVIRVMRFWYKKTYVLQTIFQILVVNINVLFETETLNYTCSRQILTENINKKTHDYNNHV